MGAGSKNQTSTTSPWQPSVAGREYGINEATSLMQGYGAPTAPKRSDYESWSYGPSGAGPGMFGAFSGENNYSGGHNPLAARAAQRVMKFDDAGYQAALERYNAAMAKGNPQDPVYKALDELQRVNELGSPMEEAAYQYGSDVLGGKYLNAGNPYLQHMIDRSAQDVNAQFGMGGRYGSGAHAGRLMDQSLGLRYQNYGDERNWMNAMAGLSPTISALRYAPAQYGLSIAQAREGVPWDRLSRYADVVNALSGGGGSSTVPIYNNRGAQIAGMGLTALGALAAPYTGGASLLATGALNAGIQNRAGGMNTY